MVLKFVVEDAFHSTTVATFRSREEALASFERLRNDPENKAPFGQWGMCRSEYHLLDYDDEGRSPWTLLKRKALFAIDFAPSTSRHPPLLIHGGCERSGVRGDGRSGHPASDV